MRRILAVCITLSATILMARMPAWADGEEDTLVPPRISVLQEKTESVDVTISLLGRASIIEGDIESDIGIEYGNLFNSGAGLVLEGAILWGTGSGWKMGPYVSFGYDAFGGETFYDRYGDSLEADDLFVITFLLGGKAQCDFGSGFYGDVHVGLGFANYTEVNGIMRIMSIPIGVEIFSGGSAFAFDIGSRLGFNVCNFLFLEIGFDIRAQGAPQEGNINLSPDSPAIYGIEFGGGFRF